VLSHRPALSGHKSWLRRVSRSRVHPNPRLPRGGCAKLTEPERATVHAKMFDTVKPSDVQLEAMDALRKEAQLFVHILDVYVPEGADKTYLMRKFRDVIMWANVAIMRNQDGSPRE
jgi:hypothetical protein